MATEASLTQTGQVLGTAAYISPEQARGHAATDASDRYALAVVAFELLTGRRPFTADHPAAQARAHVEDSVPSASAAATGLPPRVDRVLATGMAKDPAQRPATAADFMDALEDAHRRRDRPRRTADRGDRARRAGARRGRRPARPASRPPAPSAAGPAWPPSPRSRSWPARPSRSPPGPGARAAAAPARPSTRARPRTAPRSPRPSPRPRPRSRRRRPRRRPRPRSRPRRPSPRQTTQAPPAAQAKSDDPVALNDQGFALIGQGKPNDAVAPLQRSVAAFRAQGRKGEIGYAYALYNLGNALRLSGRPAEAIPFLQERLQISNYKRGIVKKELKTAQQQAGQ